MPRPGQLPEILQANARELPRLLAIPGEAVIAAAAAEGGVPSFSMEAYTGVAMWIEGFAHPVVVDLEGIVAKRQTLPIRMDHQPAKGVGHSTRVAVEGGKLIAQGLISRETSWAHDVARSGKNGFPWQASIGAGVIRAEFIPAGRQVEVNGRGFEGPIYVAREVLLREISFVDEGADDNSSARVAAQAAQTRTGDETMDFKQWLKAKGFDDEALTDEQRVTLEAAYDAQQATDQGAGQDAGEQGDSQQGADDPAPPQETPAPAETPNPDTAQAPTPPAPPQVQASAPMGEDPIAQRRRREAAEVRRIEAIRAACKGKHPEIEAQAIEQGWDADRTELQILRASRPSVPATVQTARPSAAGPRVYEAVALMASGMAGPALERHFDGRTLEAAERLRGIGIQEFCELACGQRLPRFRRDSAGWLQAAFSSTSLPGILSNVANKMLLEGYNYIEDAWRKICRIASVNDFKEHTRYRMTGAFQFLKVGPDGELKHGALDEQTFSQRADTHGIMFALTRQMIINDDMGAFTDIPRQIGMGAAEAIAEAVWRLWLSNPTQADGKSFFHADRGNLATGADSALTVDGLTAAGVLFGDQVKPNGKPLGVPARLLVVPTALEVPARLLMTSGLLNETTTANKGKPAANPHVGTYEVVGSSYLSNRSFTGYSSKAWYLQADPNRLPAIEVAFLNGVDRPTVQRADADFNTLGIQFRGFIDFGVKEQDYRGAVKMAGE